MSKAEPKPQPHSNGHSPLKRLRPRSSSNTSPDGCSPVKKAKIEPYSSADLGDSPLANASPRPSSPTHKTRTSQMEGFWDHHMASFTYVIEGKTIGLLDVDKFLTDFLPGDNLVLMQSQQVEIEEKLQRVAAAKAEVDMYKPWVEAMNILCPDLEFVDISKSPAPRFKNVEIKPDTGIYTKTTTASGHDITLIESMQEFKMYKYDDPFTDDPERDFEMFDNAAGVTLGQMALYATAHLAAQFRTHVFSALILPAGIRLLYWDRSAVAVSKRVPLDDPRVLTFFQRFNNATPEQRGHDISISPASLSKEDETLIRKSLRCEKHTPLFQTSISGDTHILPRKSTYDNVEYPTGRSSRAFTAYSMRREELVFVKDTWREISPGLVAEHETYKKLHDLGVPHIPLCFGGEDVLKGKQYTKTTKIAADYSGLKLQKLRHYRISLELMTGDITQCRRVNDMVKVARDAAIAHEQATEVAKILHRDISINNIMFKVKDGQLCGYLIDWDLCCDVEKSNSDMNKCTGTWQFRAVRLQEGEKRAPQSRIDDVESFYHVLAWIALRRTAHEISNDQLSILMYDLFDDSSRGRASWARKLRIESGKVETYSNRGLRALLKKLASVVSSRYHEDTSRSPNPLFPTTLQLLMAERYDMEVVARQKASMDLADPGWLPRFLTEFLGRADLWTTHNDMVEHVIPDRGDVLRKWNAERVGRMVGCEV